MPRALAYVCLAISMMLVGSYVGLSRRLLAEFPVFLLAWLRFGIAAVAMLPWLRREAAAPALAGRTHRLLFAESFFGNFGFSICMLFGVAATSAVAAGVVMATLPPAVALLAWLLIGTRVTPRIGGAILCAVIAVAVLATAAPVTHNAAEVPARGASAAWGYALLLGAVGCEAIYVVLGARLTQVLSPRRISALINLWGLALMTPFGLWQAAAFDFTRVHPGTWALLVYYAVAASMVAVWLWMQGLRRIPAPEAGVFTVLLPLTSAAIGVGWLGEPLHVAHGVAFALAVAGLLLTAAPERRATRKHSAP